jgi:hypothetical protein
MRKKVRLKESAVSRSSISSRRENIEKNYNMGKERMM